MNLQKSILVIAFCLWNLIPPSAQARLPFSRSSAAPHNFGMLMNIPGLTIYRSSRLGAPGLARLQNYLRQRNLPFPKSIIYMNKDGYNHSFPLRHDFALEEYKLQKKYGYKFYHPFDYPHRTYLDGVNPYRPGLNIDQRGFLSAEARILFSVQEHPQKDGDLSAFFRIMETVLDPSKGPVLFHCTGGFHRTGMIALAIRYMQGGEWIDGPKRKVRPVSRGFRAMYLNPAQYEYYLHNRIFFRPANLTFIEKVAQDPRFKKLQDKLQQYWAN